jgi:uncharacterized protein (DUF362 family)
MGKQARVAVVRGEDRGSNIRRALDLLGDEALERARGKVLVKPNLLSSKVQLASTHVDALEAVLTYLRDGGAREIVIAEGSLDTWKGYKNFGYIPVAEKYGVPLVDICAQKRWREITLMGLDGEPLRARLWADAWDFDCRISLAIPKAHDTATVTLSLKNSMGFLAKPDRLKMHGIPVHPWLERVTMFSKRILNLRPSLLEWTRQAYWNSKPEERFRQSVRSMSHNLTVLAKNLAPHLAILDGFRAMEGEGPTLGDDVEWGVALAGLDFLAVDTVAATIMGFDPRTIGYLHLMREASLGVGDLENIEILGEELEAVTRNFKPHSNFEVQKAFGEELLEKGIPAIYEREVVSSSE